MYKLGAQNKSSILLFLVLIVVIGFLVSAFGFNFLSGVSTNKTFQKTLPLSSCNPQHFAKDYGDKIDVEKFAYENKLYYKLTFDEEWPAVAVSKRDTNCFFIEDFESSEKLFIMYSYLKNVKTNSKNFYSPFIECNYVPKGADVACKITTTITEISDSNAVALLLEVPEFAFDKVKSQLEGTGWEIIPNTGKGATRLFKKFQKGTAIYATIDLIKVTSCSLNKTELVKVFDLANDINQTYTDTHNDFSYSNTINDIKRTNQTIDVLYLLHEENPDLFFDAYSMVANYFVAKQYCNEFNPLNELKGFQEKLIDYEKNGVELNQKFQEKISNLKNDAKYWLMIEEQAKINNGPKGWNELKIFKRLEYGNYSSGSKEAFEKQEYPKTQILAIEGVEYYASFWENTTTEDFVPVLLIFGIVLIGIIILILFLIWKFIKKALEKFEKAQ